MDDIPERVAVLEQIARNTESILTEFRADMREARRQQHTDFLWLLSLQIGSFIGLLGVLARGFHWL